jgi:hypothetical protein
VRVQEVRWDGGGTEPAAEYTFFYERENENHELGTGFFVHKRSISAVKRVELASDRTLYITLSGRWYDITVLNVHALREGKNVEVHLLRGTRTVFDNFPKYHIKMLLRDLTTK